MRMFKIGPAIAIIAALAWMGSVFAEEPNKNSQSHIATATKPVNQPKVALETSLGTIVIELWPDKAPITVENFLQYVDSGFYNGVIFHRIVPEFMVQVGGYDAKYQKKQLRPPIKNESNNGLLNLRSTLSMARTMSPDSATSQFFINLVDNPALDEHEGSPGYAVFGGVIEGMDVVDRMPSMPQGQHTGAFMNAPNDPILIKKAYRLGKKPDTGKKPKP